MFTITTPQINEETAEAYKSMNQTLGFGVIAKSQKGDGYKLRPVLKDEAKLKPKENEQMTEGEIEKRESVIRTTGTSEAIMEIHRRSELDKDGRLIKDNLRERHLRNAQRAQTKSNIGKERCQERAAGKLKRLGETKWKKIWPVEKAKFYVRQQVTKMENGKV